MSDKRKNGVYHLELWVHYLKKKKLLFFSPDKTNLSSKILSKTCSHQYLIFPYQTFKLTDDQPFFSSLHKTNKPNETKKNNKNKQKQKIKKKTRLTNDLFN